MKWVVLAIVIVIIPYTWLSLKYRKPGPAYEPYEDSKNRAMVLRLLNSGYQRIPVDADRPDLPLRAPAPGSAAITRTAGGVPPGLGELLIDPPPLPVRYTLVSAPADIMDGQPCPVLFTAVLPDIHREPGGAEVYLRGGSIVIAPAVDSLEGDLNSRSLENPIRLVLPARSLKPGIYRVQLAGSAESVQWTLQVH